MKSPEDALVHKIEAAAKTPNRRGSLRLGPGDDAALWMPRAGREAVLTCDWFLEGTHFLRRIHPPDSVGWKCLARAVSDIAAMGGEPRCFLLSLAVPPGSIGRWLDQFLAGLRRADRRFACPLAGGDTTRRREVLINITVLGEVPSGEAILRSGAKAGDRLFVSGRLGEAEFGLRSLRRVRGVRQRDSRPVRKHLYPEPRLALGQWLAKSQIATAMMDLSDGLSTDLPRLCAASGVGAVLNATRIPGVALAESPKLTAASRLALALHGGDDYELLFTVKPRNVARVPRAYQGLALTQIGEITPRRQLTLIAPNGTTQPLLPAGWDPFRR